MAPLRVTLFLITLLLPSIHTEESVLTETQKDSTTSSNRKTNHKAVLDKTDHQGDGNIQDPEKVFSASKQDKTLFEDFANGNQHELNPSKNKMSRSNYCTQKSTVNFNHIDNRLQGTRVRHQRDNFKYKGILDLDEILYLAIKRLASLRI
ncbi:exocrine gland-secreted peptide 1-like [Grammomys surdaster]|uniref:exocrine gland-secreted peptide 1-like n=1 Tax=Grammomys surdaster TaxID=491861 RepID=UPI0010A0A3AB|nr:exocrine gland-secreted peptide 1-like [Grammomys surdaster]